jgi:hypothetical protein
MASLDVLNLIAAALLEQSHGANFALTRRLSSVPHGIHQEGRMSMVIDHSPATHCIASVYGFTSGKFSQVLVVVDVSTSMQGSFLTLSF